MPEESRGGFRKPPRDYRLRTRVASRNRHTHATATGAAHIRVSHAPPHTVRANTRARDIARDTPHACGTPHARARRALATHRALASALAALGALTTHERSHLTARLQHATRSHARSRHSAHSRHARARNTYLTSGSRADRTARRAARQRATHCAPSARSRPHRDTAAVCSSHAHTHSRNATAGRDRRAPQPAAASHSLPARAPTAPHSAQHFTHEHSAPHASHATPWAPSLATHTNTHHNAPARRDAAGPSAHRRLALASGSRADRTASCAPHVARNTLRATLRTRHIARRPLNTHTHARHERPDTPRRCGPFSPPPPHTRLRLARRPHLTSLLLAARRGALTRAARARSVGRRGRDGSTLDRRSTRRPAPPALNAAHILRRASLRGHTPWPRGLDGRPPSSRCCAPLVAATPARAARARSVGRRSRDGSTLGRRSMRRLASPALNAAQLRRAPLRGHTSVAATAQRRPAVESLLPAARRGNARARYSRPLGRPPLSRRLDTRPPLGPAAFASGAERGASLVPCVSARSHARGRDGSTAARRRVASARRSSRQRSRALLAPARSAAAFATARHSAAARRGGLRLLR